MLKSAARSMRRGLIYPSILFGLSFTASADPTPIDYDHVADLVSQAAKQASGKENDGVHQEANPSFGISPELMAEGKLQMGIVLMSRQEFANSPYVGWDVDGLHTHMSDEDRVMVSKAAGVIRDQKPEAFTVQRLLDGSKNASRVVGRPSTINYDKTYFTYTINNTVTFEGYNVKNGFEGDTNPEYMSHEHKDFFLNIAPVSDNDHLPEKLTTSYSQPGDISKASHGGRLINYYYNLNDKDTLYIAYRVITFKKEPEFSKAPMRWLGVWDKILKKGPEEQLSTAWHMISTDRGY